MKRLILLLMFVAIQFSWADNFELTSWKNESACRIVAVDAEKILIVTDQFSAENSALKLSTDGGSSWSDLDVNSIETSTLKGCVSGDAILLYWGENANYVAVSTDVGKSWNYEPTGLPKDQQIVKALFSGSRAFLSMFGDQGGVFASTDGGANWTNISPNIDYAKFGEISIVNGCLYAASDQGVYFSEDHGSHWEELIGFPTLVTNLNGFDNALYSIYENSFLRSNDKGRTWSDVGHKLPVDFKIKHLAFINDKIIVTSQNEPSSNIYSELYVSTDKGESWIKKNAAPFLYSDVGTLLTAKNYIIAYAYDSLFLSTNYGETWINEIKGLPWGKYVISEPKISDSKLSVSIGNQIYVSEDVGLNWRSAYGKVNYGQVVDFASLGDTLFVACRPGPGFTTYEDVLYFSTDKGENWNRLGMIGEALNSLRDMEGRLLVKTPSKLTLSSDRGATWKDAESIWKNNIFVEYLFFEKEKIFTGSKNNGVRFSNTDGESWEMRNKGLPIQYSYLDDLWLIGGNLFASVNYNLYFSSDDGVTWTLRTNGIDDNIDKRFRIEGNGTDTYLAQGQDLYFSSDAGENWTKLESIYEISGSNSISTFKIIGDALIVSISNKGLFVSMDKGITWSQKYKNQPGSMVNLWSNLFQVGDYGYLSNERYGEKYASYAIYRTKLEDLLSTQDEQSISAKLSISPNPVSEFLNLRAYVGSANHFTIVNALGQPVLTGVYDGAEINISSLPSGTYFLRIGDETSAFVKM